MIPKDLPSVRNSSTMAVLFGIVLLCFLWVGLYYKVQSERQMEVDNAVKETANYARTFEEHTLRTLKGLDQIALLLKSQAEKDGLAIDIPRLLSEEKIAAQPFVQLGLADENGDTVISNIVPFVHVNIKDLEHFSVHREVDSGKVFISTPLKGRTSGKWSIQLTRRINKADGSFGGVVVVSADPYYFAEFYKQINLGSGSLIAIVGRDGVVRVRQSDNEVQMGMNFSQRIMAELTGDEGNYSAAGLTDGIRRIYSYRKLREFPLIVVVGVSEAQVFQNLNQRVIGYFWVCGAVSILIILFVVSLLMGFARRRKIEEELMRSAEIQAALREIAEAAVLAASLEELYAKVHQSVERILPAKNFFIAMLEKETGDILVPYCVDETRVIPARRPQGKGMTEYALRQGKTIHLTAADYERLWQSGEIKLRYTTVNEWLGAPLKNSNGEGFGVIAVFSIGESQGYSREHLAAISIIAAQVSMAIERKLAEEGMRNSNILLEATVENRTQELFAANQELSSVNEELTAMNEEMSAMNESLEEANRTLAFEIDIRQQKEQELLLREKQYRATTDLLTNPAEDIHELLESILKDAVQLVGAPGGHITLVDHSGKNFVFCHTTGINSEEYMISQPIDQGVLGEVYRSAELFCMEDYRLYPRRINKEFLKNFTTGLMMPLIVDSKVMGILTANWQNEVHSVTAEDIEIFRQFGGLASIALERANTGAQITYKNQLLQGLAETTAFLVNELDLEKALQNILSQAVSFMGIPHGFIALFEQDGRQAHIKCGVGRYGRLTGKRMNFAGRGLFAEVLRTGRTVVINDYAHWSQRLNIPANDEMTAAMQAPLNIDGKTIGSIGMAIFDEPLLMDLEKITVFEQFATIAAIAVKNALAHQKANHQAFHDTLTGLPNRAHLNKRLEAEMERAREGEAFGVVMFIDLDDLKTVNDHFGHTCGDSVIIASGEDIVGALGEEAFVARVGGDEFIVMLSGEKDLKRIEKIADRLVGAIRREYEVRDQRIHMSTSIGVTLYPGDGDAAEEILKKADIAMYAAKSAGKNCWRFYEAAMLKDTYEKMMLTNSLRHALGSGELYLHYQPLISLGEGGKVTGFEALLRWDGREHGSVSPARFIPLAEQSGLILPIGEWVIGEACRFAGKLADMGRKNVHVGVNVSPRQLAAEDFVEIVRRCIDEAGIEPEQLEVEITENVLIVSLEDSTSKLAELSALGVKLSLDDFGTGFSSLTYLRNLPVAALKIDKAFIDKILEDKVQEGFIRSIIEMAHVLSLNVVAEGVETEAQLAKLTQLGCDCVQGYVFSRPVSQEEALRFSI